MTLAGVFVGILASIEKDNLSKKDQNDQLISDSTKNAIFQKLLAKRHDNDSIELKYSNKKIDALRDSISLKDRQIIEKDNKIIQTQEETYNSMRGSLKHPIIEVVLSPWSSTKNLIKFTVYSEDKYPIHLFRINFSMIYNDLQITSQSEKGIIGVLNIDPNFGKDIILNEITQNNPQVAFQDYFPVELVNLHYHITFSWQNISYQASIEFKMDKDGFYELSKLFIFGGKDADKPSKIFKIINIWDMNKKNMMRVRKNNSPIK